VEYQPLTLTDYKAGLFTSRKPWLSPKETFRTLDNALIRDGRVQGRPGYVPFGALCTVTTSTLAAGSSASTFSGTIPGPYPYNISDGGVRITGPGVTPMHDRDGDGILYLEGGASVGAVNYTNGAVSWTLAGATTGAAARSASRRNAAGLPVTGLAFFTPKLPGTYIIASDTQRIYLYNTVTETFDDISGVVFTGGNNDLVQMVPFDDMLILNNGIDPPRKFVPPNVVSLLGTDFDGDLTNDVDQVTFIIRHRNRLLLCGTTENGVLHPGRVRRTMQGNPEGYDTALDASDAPTNRDIISAGLLGDNVVIYFTGAETWAHRYTGDLASPYEWVQVSTTSGGDARLAVVRGERTLYNLSLDGVHESDGIQNQNIDEMIDGAVQAIIDPTNVLQSVGIYTPNDDFVYWAGVQAGLTHNNRMLVLDSKRTIWSLYTFGMRAFALQTEPVQLIWDALGLTLVDSLVGSADALGLGEAGEQLFGGDEFGVVHRLNVGDTDNGVEIQMRAATQLIAPYGPTVESRLGWVDIVMDRRDGEIATVSLFRDYDSLSYASEQVSLTGQGANTKVRKRVRAGQLARFHQIEISMDNAGNGWGVDLIEMHCSPARGGMRLL
jgi:hypothetical protein